MSIKTNSCPCCGGSLLRHVRHGSVYWFCQTCWQEVPLLTVSQMSTIEGRNKGAIPQSTTKA